MSSFNFSDEYLAKMWDEFDFFKAEEKINKLQCKLTKATFMNNKKLMKKISMQITSSIEARALAVRQVSEINHPAVGVDGVRWITSVEKMMAALNLTSKGYRAQNYKRFIINDIKASKERKVSIPTMRDRAMQILHMMALSPISEALADRKSFAYRKVRSSLDVHALIIDILSNNNAPKYILICDIKSYYDSISHEWLLRNIPMDKHVLRELLDASIVFDNELFPHEDIGISLGNNISTILGNMTLDGIQKLLYDLQDKNNIDYFDGYTIRYADDILVTARSIESAKRFLKEIEKFAFERGLVLSDKKTYITTLDDGFDFLSRHYYKTNEILHSTPSKKSVLQIENELSLLININNKFSQKKLIEQINAKLNGWATYHRVEESLKEFRHIDNVISALLLKYVKLTHPKTNIKTLIKKYWYIDYKGRHIFSLPTNRNIKVIKLEDVLLVKHKKLNTKKNIYLDKKYFEDRTNFQNIIKVSGKFKNIWNRQNGKCYFCNTSIKINQPKKIIIKDLTKKDFTIRNMAYVHENCIDSETNYINIKDINIYGVNVKEIINNLDDYNLLNMKIKNSKYNNLYEFFSQNTKQRFCISFEEIENIIGKKLCNSLYSFESYWNRKGKNLISNCWLQNGYDIYKVYINKKKVSFIRRKKSLSKINIPNKILSSNIPSAAKSELECFFDYIIIKYGL